ncbi:P-loop containing nucleoside triphosphate hydrolase protein [Diplogelasinospora grovesii]|uniref:P-loop containing nucleoside triphosphate hydrolase protein n=1 Tax=Diplogelasinospora grovesii TaxID=303347 RepID=A0AAN6NJ28_9PEZI|nr:P-loop containing nucleoside triphosphate hydrolase protein [Diplogelasinospora grovesii]
MGDMAAPDIALDSLALDELNSPEARALLDTIDSLRELQVGEIVNLPQIIVVGDQSSGKSSVLEAISRVRFPTKGDLCTRFATELVLRRAPESKIGVRIDSAGSGSSQQFHRTSFDEDALPEIISEATGKMGIRAGSAKGFSEDILHVEISGPNVCPVTLVDLPGFFHSETSDQTQEGRAIVRQLAERYMKQPKSIILTVVSANHNLANQIVVEEARKHDPNRERTLGIITKPDLAAPGSQDERKCLQLVRGQESMHKLKLGWHVLRNRPEGQERTSADDRDAAEERFFKTGAWSSVAPTSRGITHLRKKLSRVLLEHIQKTLPSLVEEIESNLSTRQRALEQLGKPRSQPEELRTYLLEIAERFQRLARDGVDGRYGDDEFFGDLYNDRETRKLRALLRRLNRAFHATLVTKGVDREIQWDDDDEEGGPLQPNNDGGFDWIRNGGDAPGYLEPFLGLFDMFPAPAAVSETDLCRELEQLAAANQGTEFPGMPNGNLGFQLFKMQAKPWGGIADFYLDQVADFAKSFVEELFTHVIGADKQTANAVLVFCVGDFFEEKRRLLKDKLQEILRPYADAYGPPLDAEFHAALSSRTIRREAGRVASLLEEKFPAAFTDKGGRGLTREQVEVELTINAEKDTASEFGTGKVIDMAMTHFQISLRTFAENVVNLAVENCLISDLPTILTPSMVIRMDEERLKELASESEDVQIERHALQYEVKILREGLKKCQKSRLHKRTGSFRVPS